MKGPFPFTFPGGTVTISLYSGWRWEGVPRSTEGILKDGWQRVLRNQKHGDILESTIGRRNYFLIDYL